MRIKRGVSLLGILLVTVLVINPVNCRPNSRRRAGKEKSSSSTCGYDSCAKTADNLINVHLVAHTHDDVGWLKTVDQYYYGSKTEIQKAGVQYILDSVVAALLKDPKKKFIYVESAFFFKWWREQTPETQDQVKMLVAEGRLEFIGGAWSMNDEATTHYQSIVDQFTWGLRRLNDTFGECGRPKIGWQIDPFGHSREQASLFAQMSFDGYFFGRIHYEDKARRLMAKEMEMVWQASDNLGESAEIFTGALFNTYSPPSGFCWDMLCSDEPFVDNKHSKDYNVDRLLKKFFEYADKVASGYRSNNILITMGEDFNYQDANMWFKNLDKLIKYGNELQSQGSKYNFIYSTPSCYLKALHQSNVTWPTYSQDFFPYASDQTAVWTGYFTSRPTVKRYERMGNHFAQVCKQLTSLAFLKNIAKKIDAKHDGMSLESHLTFMREQMGVMQHHDAVTGTEKQHVADDYILRMFIAMKACNYNAQVILNELVNPQDENDEVTPKKSSKFTSQNPHEEMTPKVKFEFASCHLLNISECAISDSNGQFMVTVYNPLAHSTFQPVRIPVPHKDYQVRDYRKVPVQIQMVPVTDRVKKIPFRKSTAEYEIVFIAEEVPPLGYKSYFVESKKEREFMDDSQPIVVLLQNDEPTSSLSSTFEWINANKETNIVLGNGKVIFDSKTGRLVSLNDNEVTQEFFYYNAAAGDNRHPNTRASGAYILRPNGTENYLPNPQIKVVQGPLVDEVYQQFNEWTTQVVRVYHTQNPVRIDFSWTVGPIPVVDEVGKEIVSRFCSKIDNKGEFFTDSNGREMLKRVRNDRPLWENEKVAINYYPLNSKIYIEDKDWRMAVLTDRAQGASSLQDGCIDVMVHRRLLHDDAFGVGEALDEEQFQRGLIATGTLTLMFNNLEKEETNESPAALERFMQNEILIPNWLFFSTVNDSYDDWQSRYKNIGTNLGLALPKNVYLMTLEPWRKDSYLVRFEHLLEKNEDENYSKNVTFNFLDVFGTLFTVESIRETNLAANQWLSDVKRFKFSKERKGVDEKSIQENEIVYPGNSTTRDEYSDYVITLAPMQMRTFVMKVQEQL